jgi:hypothetical protein
MDAQTIIQALKERCVLSSSKDERLEFPLPLIQCISIAELFAVQYDDLDTYYISLEDGTCILKYAFHIDDYHWRFVDEDK